MGLLSRGARRSPATNTRPEETLDPRPKNPNEQVTHFLKNGQPWERVTVFEYEDPSDPGKGYKEPKPFERACTCSGMTEQARVLHH